MIKSIPLKPSENDLLWWLNRFVPEFVLWWWDDSAIPNDFEVPRVLNRANCRHDPIIGDIRYVNAFHTWAMHEEVQKVIVDDGSWISSLSPDARRSASELQVRFSRGLCIPHQRFGEHPSFPEYACFDGRVVLDQSLWVSLTERAKRSVIQAELPDWDRDITYPVPEATAAHIANIANSFMLQEGVNCLAVVAYAVTGNRDDLHQWLLPDVFIGLLQSAGYSEINVAAPDANDIIVFKDDDGNIVHAAYTIQPDRILNKSGQTSFNPIAITDLASLREDWAEYRLVIQRR